MYPFEDSLESKGPTLISSHEFQSFSICELNVLPRPIQNIASYPPARYIVFKKSINDS